MIPSLLWWRANARNISKHYGVRYIHINLMLIRCALCVSALSWLVAHDLTHDLWLHDSWLVIYDLWLMIDLTQLMTLTWLMTCGNLWFVTYVTCDSQHVTRDTWLMTNLWQMVCDLYAFWLMIVFTFQTKEQDLVIPAHKSEPGEEYAGATVIEPNKGWG